MTYYTHEERARIAAAADAIRRANGVTQAARANTALRMVRVAIREGRKPTVRLARDAIIHCATQAETRADGGAAVEAMRLAPYAIGRGA